MEKNVQFDFYFACLTSVGEEDTSTAPTVTRSLDGGTFASPANAAARIGATNCFKLTLTAEEMNTSCTVVKVTGTGLQANTYYLYPEANWTTTRAGYLDAGVSTRSSHSAADVWAVTTRTLTGYGTLVADIKTSLEAAGSSIASIISHLVGIKGGGWVSESLVSIKAFIDSINNKTTNLPADPASNTQVNTRLAGSAYTAPDNAGISTIAGKVANLPAQPAGVGDAMTLTPAYDAAKSAASQGSMDAVAVLIDTIMGDTFTDQTLVAIKAAIDSKLSASAYVAPDNAKIDDINSRIPTALVDGKIPAVADVSLTEENINAMTSSVVDALQDNSVVVTSPVSEAGDISIVAGDSYDSSLTSRRISWSSSGWSDLTGASIVIDTGDKSFEINAETVGVGEQVLSLDLTAEDTVDLRNGEYQIRATWADVRVETLATGKIYVMYQN